MGRIDVGKLRGKYYNNDRDSYYDANSSLSDVKTTMSVSDFDACCNTGGMDEYNDSEEILLEYIKSQPFAGYNDILDEDSESMSRSEMTEYLLQTYIKFQDEMSVSFILLTFCDYFNINYQKIIKDLPNLVQLKLYKELSVYMHDEDLLNTIFSIDIDLSTPSLF